MTTNPVALAHPTLFGDNRPPYWVKSMAERKLIQPNGLTAVSTFSGCGGSSLGMKAAGYTIPYAVEFIGPARDTYAHNAPETFIDGRDIRDVQGADILNYLGMDVGELDLFEGSPPCSSFSIVGRCKSGNIDVTAGKIKNYSDGVKQATDDLFDHWIRLVGDLRPKTILAENVPALADAGPSGKFLHSVVRELEALGYNLHVAVYSSLNAGAATMRRRLIFLGVRNDIGVVPRPRLMHSGYTLREGLATLPSPPPQDEYDFYNFEGLNPKTGEPYLIAQWWAETPRGTSHHARFSTIRCSWDKPAFTFTATPGTASQACGVMHPDMPRTLTPHEAKWLSGFPIDFELLGTPGQRMERIGRAVTPPLYEALTPFLAEVITGQPCVG